MARILIAYDGSDCSDRALRDLPFAGLPSKAEAVVLTVADSVVLQVSGAFAGEETPSNPEAMALLKDRMEEERALLRNAEKMSKEAAEEVRRMFPGWTVKAETAADLPFWGIVAKIESWEPDLVVMGSHGRSAAGRLLFGSNAHGVLTHVHCNLRIVKGGMAKASKREPARILVALDGSQEAETAFQAVLCREWPEGTRIKLVSVIDARVVTAFARPTGPIRYWLKDNETDPVAWVDRMLSDLKSKIEQKGWIGDSEVLHGDPKRRLLEEAESWRADCIFTGSRGLTGRERIIAGSASTSLAMHAHCPVEIVHRLWGEKACCEAALAEHRDCMLRTGKK